LLQRANDDHLVGVIAHEISHQDSAHAVKAQMLGAGLSIGAALLEQIVPGSGAIAPLAGTLIARGHRVGPRNMPPTVMPLCCSAASVIRRML
jgi:Zn-dependent protease with chaperone function